MISFKQIAINLGDDIVIEASGTAKVNDMVVAIAGEAWGGILTLNDFLHLAAARLGINVKAFPTFPPEIRGGACNVVANLNDRGIPATHGYSYDIVVALEQRDVDDFSRRLKPDGVLIYDSSDNKIYVEPKPGQTQYAVPCLAIARSLGEQKPNVVAFGALANLLGIPLEVSEKLISDKFAGKGRLVERNLKAFRAGHDYAVNNLKKTDPYQIERSGNSPLLFMPGNEAATFGLLAAGLTRFFGYPITPSSEGFQMCLEVLPLLGGRAVQMENEGAAILAVIGSFFAGQKTATFTSGPGLSLMTEGLSLAYMMELPAVVVNSMRGGPSTGLPTKTEQSDLLTAIFAPHGDATNVVLAARSVPDAFYMAIAAMNLAVKYQTPTVLLLDTALSLGGETMLRPDLSNIHVEQIRQPSQEQLQKYRRYLRDADGIAPMAIPGTPGGRYLAGGLEHDVAGRATSASQVHMEMSRARLAKIMSVANDPMVQGFGRRFGSENPTVGLVGWGTTEGPIREALAMAKAEGIEAAAYVPGLMWPFDHGVTAFAKQMGRVIVPEQNQGQLARLIRSEALVPTTEVSDLSGLPMNPRLIFDAIVSAQRSA